MSRIIVVDSKIIFYNGDIIQKKCRIKQRERESIERTPVHHAHLLVKKTDFIFQRQTSPYNCMIKIYFSMLFELLTRMCIGFLVWFRLVSIYAF